MYKVISANRGSHKAPKNWRVFEQENLEKHFGKVLNVDGEDGHSVLDAYNKYADTLEYIRWYPCPETCNSQEYSGVLSQDKEIDLKYITNSAKGFESVQSKEVCFREWKKSGVNCPDYFVYQNQEEFYEKLSISNISYPLECNPTLEYKPTHLKTNATTVKN